MSSAAAKLLEKYEEVAEDIQWKVIKDDRTSIETWSIKSDYCQVNIKKLSSDDYSLAVVYPNTRKSSTDRTVKGNLIKIKSIFNKSNRSWKLPYPNLLKNI